MISHPGRYFRRVRDLRSFGAMWAANEPASSSDVKSCYCARARAEGEPDVASVADDAGKDGVLEKLRKDLAAFDAPFPTDEQWEDMRGAAEVIAQMREFDAQALPETQSENEVIEDPTMTVARGEAGAMLNSLPLCFVDGAGHRLSDAEERELDGDDEGVVATVVIRASE